jgi:hypothetical protein
MVVQRIFLFLLLFFPLALFSQQTGMIYGKVTDSAGHMVYNANVTLPEHAGGTTTNKEGYYELKVPAGKAFIVTISFIGYENLLFEVNVTSGEKKELNGRLSASSTQLESIEVKDQQMKKNTFNRLDPKSVTFIPSVNSNIEDLIKTMPGVSSRNEMSSQYSVRGGNYDENLVFINDIEVYRPFLIRSGQQEGQSVINPDLVSSINFSAGGFDAKYGDKLSSVLDIRYKRPTSFAGSADVSLLGANAHVEGPFSKKISYLLGVRYKTYTYFLKGLDTKGNYKPRFFDVQGALNYEISKKWEVSLLGMFSNNAYKLIPETRETSFGTLNESYKFSIYFDGQEEDGYRNWLGAVTLTYKPNSDLRLRLISSYYETHEAETYDVSGEYWLGKLEVFQDQSSSQVTEMLGVGAYVDHARNYLDGSVFNVEHRGTYEKGKSLIQWGIKYQHEYFLNTISEWELRDSAGYSLPNPPDSAGSTNPPHDPFTISRVLKADNTVSSNRVSAFAQDTWTFKNEKNEISLTAGLRTIYYDLNGQFLLNPRANISFKPKWKREVVFRLAAGYYSQPPTFRELTDLEGNLVLDLKAQNSIQVVGGSDLYFKAWSRPFKFVAEAYYKYLSDIIPYSIDNMKIRYYGTNDAYGYAAGIDFRINGEFVKGVESWASLSLMKTMENIDGEWIPRPTDQRLNLSIFFQDYIPHYPTWRMNLTLFYGTGIPFGPPDSPRSEQTLRIPPYRRVDIGLSKQIIGDKTHFSDKNPLRAIHSMWISLEVFNLLQISNTVSYIWVTDINNVQYAVPNYLTPRQFNLKLLATF